MNCPYVFSTSWSNGGGLMNINTSEGENKSQISEILRHFEEAHKEDIETITQVLAKITNHTPEQIKLYLDAKLERLVEPKERPFYETVTFEEWSQAFREWVDTHRGFNLPHLSDEAISRESIYEDRG
ncbi:MAG: hypothetical protein ACHBN1_24160 [Heteroscytonema crispum UTEX LB 1556]